jgi:hypothetical protein
MFKIIKIVLMCLLLGLGVHFGFLTPRNYHGLNYAGIFGKSYLYVVAATLLILLFYRLALMFIRVRAFQIENVSEKLDEYVANQKPKKPITYYILHEAILLGLVMLPIVVGIGWTYKLIEISGLSLAIWRIITILSIVLSIGIIYAEYAEFPKIKLF